MCNGSESSDDIVACVKNKTFTLEDAVSSAYKGFYLDYPEAENLTGNENWSWDLTSAWQGRWKPFLKSYNPTWNKVSHTSLHEANWDRLEGGEPDVQPEQEPLLLHLPPRAWLLLDHLQPSHNAKHRHYPRLWWSRRWLYDPYVGGETIIRGESEAKTYCKLNYI